MPTEILDQLKSLREGMADKLKKDPRYLTLTALDKSIDEISSVLIASGLLPAEHVGAPAPLHFTPEAVAGSASSAFVAKAPASASPATEADVAPDGAASASGTKASAAASPTAGPDAVANSAASATLAKTPLVTPSSADVVKKKKKKSILKPALETAAIVGAAAVAAEIYSEMHGKPAAKAAAKPAAEANKGDSDEESEPGEHEEGPDKNADASSEGTSSEDATEDDAGAHANSEHGAAEDGEAAEAEHGESERDDDQTGEAGDKDQPTEAGDGNAAIPKGKTSGYKAMAAKPGAAQYQPAIAVKFGKLPNKVDLRSLMTPVEDQGDTNSCVANAVAGAYEYWIKKASKQDENISRLFVYYNARWRDGSQDKDEGSVIQLAMEGLSKFGACSEKVWPFDTHLTLKKPGAEAYKDAAAYRVQDMAQVPLKLEAWKQALAEGKPIVFGCALFDSFDQCSKQGGVVPMPAPEDLARDKHSGHSMCAVGYSDSEKVFIVRNSWGADWGNKGYCYMPYAYLMNPKFNDGDCWVFVPKVPAQPPREVWSDTTDPVTNDGKGVDFEIETFKISDYEHITIDLFEKVRHPFNETVLSDYSQYVSWAGRSMWSELSSFDVATYLASAAALTGVASIAAAAYLSETSTSETITSESSETLGAMSEENSEEEDESEDDAADDDSDADDADDDSENDDSDDDDSEDGDESEDDDDAEDDDAEDDDSDDDDSEDGDESEDEDSDDDSSEDEDGSDDDEDDSEDDDDSDDGDADDDADDDDSDDSGDDDSSDDNTGDDE